MTDQIASITLRADVSDLKTASNELDKLGQAAAGAVDKADDLNSVFRAGAESAKQGSEGLKEQQNALKGLLENIDPVTKALNRLDEQQESLRKFQAKGFLDTDTFQAYNKILDDTRLKLTDTGEAAARAQAELAATQAAEKQSAALKNLLGSIDPTIRAFNSLDEQHAQLVAHFEAGRINGAQFEHFNTILNQTRERLSGVDDILPEALSRQETAARRAGISVGQYSAALRTLPAQFTDIATQLAGGQSPFLILLQQGGQIKDSFGGLGPMLQALRDALFGFNEESRETSESAAGISDAAEGLNNTSEAAEKLGRAGGLLNTFNLAIAGSVGLLALLAGAAYSSSQQFDNVARSLILMGGAGFSSMQQLNDAAKDVADNAGASLAESVDTLVQLNDTGKYTADQMTKIAKSILANAQANYEAEARGANVKGDGGTSRESRDAVSKLAQDSAKKTKEAKATLEAGDRTLENYRAQARTLTETLETLRQTGETHAKNTEFSKQQSRFAELDEAAKTRALTAQEKSLLSSREAILNAAKVVDQKNKEVEAQQKINGLAQQANKYVTQMTEKTDALRDSAGLSSRQTQRMMEEAQLRQGWLNGGGKLDDAGYKKELAALRKYYAEEDKLRGDWKAGAVAGWNEYLDAATNTYDAVKNVASSTLTGLSNMLTELMTTGTASVKEFGKSMLKMILEITNQLIVAYTVQAAMGWISGGSKGGGTPGGSYANAAAGVTFNAKGGVYDSSGLSKYVNGVYDSPQYFTFQGASKFAKGGVFGEAGPEAIMPLAKDSAGRLGVRAQGGGGMAPVINTTVNVDAGGYATAQSSSSGDAMGRTLADEMQNAALQVIQKHLKPGGMIYNFSKGR